MTSSDSLEDKILLKYYKIHISVYPNIYQYIMQSKPHQREMLFMCVGGGVLISVV